jgi:hypothetical protein
MAETEVESILREIRERVLSEQGSARAGSATPALSGGNGDGAILLRESETTDNLSQLSSHLTTTARTWDRLPPLVSNRSGSVARFELWLKRLLKRATRWFTWEQVNFNASVHHALRDLLPILASYEQELERLRAQLAQAEAHRRTEAEEHQAGLTAQLDELRIQLNELRIQLASESRALETQRKEADAQLAAADARLAAAVSEFRDRIVHLQEERRVSFKQIALETSEAATLEDRARRKTEALLEDLQRRIDQMAKGKTAG